MIARVIIYGQVQGVGFRQFVKREARKRGLTGWVKNLPNGSVAAEFAGVKEEIDEMITLCCRGPMLAQVKDISVEWKTEEGQTTSFEILHDV